MSNESLKNDHLWDDEVRPNPGNTNFSYEDNGEFYPGFSQPIPLLIIYCIAYSTVFVLGLFGNCFVVAVIYRSPRMRTVTNYFIANLAIADILVIAFCLPANLLNNILSGWVLGQFMCKFVSWLQGLSVSASINTLVAISFDRYLAICHPLRFQITSRIARITLTCIWIYSMGITLPWIIYFNVVIYYNNKDIPVLYCMETWPSLLQQKTYFLTANFLMCYLVPLVVISVGYLLIWIKVCRRQLPGVISDTEAMEHMIQRSKIKVAKMLMIVVIIFMLSWLPLYAYLIRIMYGSPFEQGSMEEFVVHQIVGPIAQWLGSANSCINPILYAFFNKKFRTGFKAILSSKKCCGTIRYPRPSTHRLTENSIEYRTAIDYTVSAV